MKSIVKGLALAVALMAVAPAANAATFVTLDPPAANGSISGVFGNSGIGLGSFTDVITFTLPAGITSATISSTMTSTTNNVDLTSVLLNGTALTLGSTGQTEFRFINNLPNLAGTQTLTIMGSSGGEGSYSGTIAFSPGVIPEPATWAMMILGFGMVGAGLRMARRPDAAKVTA